MRRMRHIKAREFQGCDIAYDFSNPASLYDATSGGALVAADGAIARADDLSGNAAHMTQGTSGYRPLRKTAALNGMDVARFDGADDYLSAGDVADLLDKPFSALVVVKKSNTSGVAGIFQKSMYGGLAGRWGIIVNQYDQVFIQPETGNSQGANLTPVSTSQIVSVSCDRKTGSNAATIKARRNAGAASASTSYTDTGASLNGTYYTYIGAYNNWYGDGVQAGTYLNGDVGEAAKWSAMVQPMPMLRLEASRARKWRIY